MFGFTAAAQGGCQGRQRFRRSHREYCQGKTRFQQPDQVNNGPEPEQLFCFSRNSSSAARETAAWDSSYPGVDLA